MPPSPRPRRSELATPASNDDMFAKAATSGADLVFLDLEDACAPAEREKARGKAARALRDLGWGRSARAALPRAFSRSAGAQASSRSRNTRSAPEAAALANMSSLLAGVASSERRGRGVGTR